MWTADVSAQTPPSSKDVLNKPSEHSLRLTPVMVRGMAREFVRNAVIQGYGLDKSREDELTEMVARRVMAAVRAIDTADGQATAERLIGTILEAVNQGQRQGLHEPVFTAESGKSFGQDMMTYMPHVRGLIRDVAQDIRPQLGMKKQIGFARDLMMVNAALEGLEGVMTRWSNGEMRPGEDPFDDNSRNIQLDADGVSEPLKRARDVARKDAELKRIVKDWEQYVKDVKAFYGFDEAQSATADSILREVTSRADTLANNSEFKSRRYQFQLWQQFRWALGSSFREWESPLWYLLTRSQQPDEDAKDALGWELKQRIDKIPRSEQLRAADRKVDARLAEIGFASDTQPAGGDAHAE